MKIKIPSSEELKKILKQHNYINDSDISFEEDSLITKADYRAKEEKKKNTKNVTKKKQ